LIKKGGKAEVWGIPGRVLTERRRKARGIGGGLPQSVLSWKERSDVELSKMGNLERGQNLGFHVKRLRCEDRRDANYLEGKEQGSDARTGETRPAKHKRKAVVEKKGCIRPGNWNFYPLPEEEDY